MSNIFKVFPSISYKFKNGSVLIFWIFLLSSLLDILWYKYGKLITLSYLGKGNIKYFLEIINDSVKSFWLGLPVLLTVCIVFVKSYLYKKVSINNLVNVLIVIILVSSLKFVVGKARPFKAQSPFDYHLFSGLSIYKGRDANSSINDENRNCKFFLGWTICLIKERASFPSGETAIAFVQLFYLIHFVNFHYRIVIIFLAILAPLFRLLLYRHWFFDCAFSIFLGWLVVRFVEKLGKKYDYNKS